MSSDKIHVRLYTYDFFDLKINTEYNLKLSYYIRYVFPASVNFYIRIYDNTDNVFKTIDLYTLNYTQSTSDQTKFVDFNFILSKDDVPTGGFKCKFCFDFEQSYTPVVVGADNYICLSQYITLEDLDDDSGWFQKIIDAIKSLPEKIGQFFTNLGTQIGDFFTELGNKVTELKNSIKSFFDNLTNNLKQWFKDVGNWFSELGDRIQQFFVDLGEDIGEFFTMLKNYILYFKHPVTLNSDGVLVDEHGKPIYNNPFDDVTDKFKTTVNGWIDTITGFIDNIDSSADSVSEWIVTGSGMINKLFNAVPVLLVLAGFGCAFIVIRKVVGR